MGEAENSLLAKIETEPKVKCTKCGNNKVCCLFTPSQLKRSYPRCRMCCYKPKGGAR